MTGELIVPEQALFGIKYNSKAVKLKQGPLELKPGVNQIEFYAIYILKAIFT